MARIQGLGRLTDQELLQELEGGGARCVRFPMAISCLFMTFYTTSELRYVPRGRSPLRYGWPYLLLSLVAGWWGIPWGPIRTVQALVLNLRGGEDVSFEIVQAIRQHYRLNATAPAPPPEEQFHLSLDGGLTRMGPYALPEVNRMFLAGTARAETLILPPGAVDWTSIGEYAPDWRR
jgi:hypothetical protein